MSLVINSDKQQIIKVKNLGWLLHNWREVESFTLLPWSSGRCNDGYLIATLRDGRTYLSGFASFEVARQWLHRPVFRGLPLYDCGTETLC